MIYHNRWRQNQSVLEGGLATSWESKGMTYRRAYKGKINNYVVVYLTTSQRVVNEIFRLPEDDTCMLLLVEMIFILVGDAADSANEFFSQEEVFYEKIVSLQPRKQWIFLF